MEPIFGTEKLIAEGSAFKQINKDFRYIMKEIGNDTRVLSLVKIHSITSIIDSLENQLNRCQNTLTSFINVTPLILLIFQHKTFLIQMRVFRQNEMPSLGSTS